MSAEIDTLHLPFIAFLKKAGLPYVNARSDRESTIAEGHPDFTILKGGRALLIEFKDKGQLSAKQKRRIAELEESGNKVHVLRELPAAYRLVTEWANPIEVMPVATGTLAKVNAGLVRFGRAVYARDQKSGALSRVRTATEQDVLNIPELSAAA